MARQDHVPFHRNPKVIAIISQLFVVAVIIGFFYWLYLNTIANLARANKPTSFSFLDQVAPFQIGFSPFLEYELGVSTYWKVFAIGIQNTIFTSVLGIIAATILGFAIGIMRLSPNWIISKLALIYIEVLRNIPLLLQIMFWNFAIFLTSLPSVRDSISLGDSTFLNNRGLYFPKMVSDNPAAFWIVLVCILIAIGGIYFLRKWAKQRQNQTGQSFPVLTASIILIIASVVIGSLISGIGLEVPKAGRFNLSGGIEIPLPLFSLWFALTTYTAAFIAENVRAGIQSVPKGQTEASSALGLQRKEVLNLVVIPQAMRVIIPPTISQFLNLTKNSSLAVAVAYEDIVAIWAGIALNQTGQALIIIMMTIAVYVTLSLTISVASNYYNARTQIVGR